MRTHEADLALDFDEVMATDAAAKAANAEAVAAARAGLAATVTAGLDAAAADGALYAVLTEAEWSALSLPARDLGIDSHKGLRIYRDDSPELAAHVTRLQDLYSKALASASR